MTVSLSPFKRDSPLKNGLSPFKRDPPFKNGSSPLKRDSSVVDEGCSSVRVAVRARPLIEKELVENWTECVSYSQDGKQVVLGKDRRFTFDHVFGPEVSQEDVYKECVKPLVESCCSGYNATVLAYGQTGSGKTFTMGCGNNASLFDEELGILPRAIRQLFECIEERSDQAEFLVKCAFVEIYNEDIKDLLHPDTSSKSISIREDAHGDIVLAGVKEEVVTNFESMIGFLEYGSVFRTTGSTLMNQHSSRSHAIFTIIVEQRSIVECAISSDVITAKFHLVDLAGSERAKRTGAVGMRFKESVTINCGLLALGNVISALGDERKRCQHVPYRESKLTRMLQDSLGGNSRTCMIACISTAGTNFEETLNTLKYANRARNIRNKPVINRDPQSVMLNQLRHEILALQTELLKSRTRNMELEPIRGALSPDSILEDQSHQEFLDDIRARAGISVRLTAELNIERQKSRERENECHVLKDEIQTLNSLVSKMEEEMLEMRTERDQYQLKLDEVNSEMMALMQVLPHWEGGNDVSPAVKGLLSEMMKRVTGEMDSEGMGFGSSDSSFSSFDRLVTADAASRRSEEFSLMTDSSASRDHFNRWNGPPRCQPEDSQGVASTRDFPSSPIKEDARSVGSNSPDRTGRDTRNIINLHLRTIRVLEERLAVKETDVKSRDEALKEATEDLARDERIFAEKMQEIKALKKLARDQTDEKEDLVQKAEKDATIIARMLEEAMAKEDELSCLRKALETSQSGRPYEFIANGVCVPGVPVALIQSKEENGDAVHLDNIENLDEAKYKTLGNASDGVLSVVQAPLEGVNEKNIEEEEKGTLHFEENEKGTLHFEVKEKETLQFEDKEREALQFEEETLHFEEKETLHFEEKETPQFEEMETPQFEEKETPQFEEKETPQFEEKETPQFEEKETPQFEEKETLQFEEKETLHFKEEGSPYFEEKEPLEFEEKTALHFEEKTTLQFEEKEKETLQFEEKATIEFEEKTSQFEKNAKFLFEKKAIEDQKNRLEEDFQIQTREIKRSKQRGNFFTKCLTGS